MKRLAIGGCAIALAMSVSSPADAARPYYAQYITWWDFRDNLEHQAPPTKSTENCISNVEFVNMPPGLTMSETEHLVDAKGKVVHTQKHGKWVLKKYQWCGYTASKGYFEIFYAQT